MWAIHYPKQLNHSKRKAQTAMYNPFIADPNISGIFLESLLAIEQKTIVEHILESKKLTEIYNLMIQLKKESLLDHYRSISCNNKNIHLDTSNIQIYDSLQSNGHAKISLLGLKNFNREEYESLFESDISRVREMLKSSEEEIIHIPFDKLHYKLAEDILFKSLNASSTFDKIFGKSNWELVVQIYLEQDNPRRKDQRGRGGKWHRDYRGRMLKMWVTVYDDELTKDKNNI